MSSAKLALGGPEIPLMTAAAQQLSDRYRIPLGYATGGVTDNMSLDIQAGIEKTSTTLFAALAGVDVIHDGASGLMGAGMLTSLRGMVIANEICQSIAYLLKGIDVDSSTIAMDVIESVGQKGTFLNQAHTAKNFRKALYISSMRARNVSLPATTEPESLMLEETEKKARELLDSHQLEPLGKEQMQKIERILSEARGRVRV